LEVLTFVLVAQHESPATTQPGRGALYDVRQWSRIAFVRRVAPARKWRRACGDDQADAYDHAALGSAGCGAPLFTDGRLSPAFPGVVMGRNARELAEVAEPIPVGFSRQPGAVVGRFFGIELLPKPL